MRTFFFSNPRTLLVSAGAAFLLAGIYLVAGIGAAWRWELPDQLAAAISLAGHEHDPRDRVQRALLHAARADHGRGLHHPVSIWCCCRCAPGAEWHLRQGLRRV